MQLDHLEGRVGMGPCLSLKLARAFTCFHPKSSFPLASTESIVQQSSFSCCQAWKSWRCSLLSDLEMELQWRECVFRIMYFECILTLVRRGGTDGWLRTRASSFLMPGIKWIQAVGEELQEISKGWKYLHDMVPGPPLRATVLGNQRASPQK